MNAAQGLSILKAAKPGSQVVFCISGRSELNEAEQAEYQRLVDGHMECHVARVVNDGARIIVFLGKGTECTKRAEKFLIENGLTP